MAKNDIKETNWTEVAAKAQAIQALHVAGLGDSKNIEKAPFLHLLGLSHPDIAGLLDSTPESVRKTLDAAAMKPKAKKEKTDDE